MSSSKEILSIVLCSQGINIIFGQAILNNQHHRFRSFCTNIIIIIIGAYKPVRLFPAILLGNGRTNRITKRPRRRSGYLYDNKQPDILFW